jgi:peptide/nickel transport system substrate-binding protein
MTATLGLDPCTEFNRVGGKSTFGLGLRRPVRGYGLRLLAAALLLGSVLPVSAADLTIGLNDSPTSMDPYYHNITTNNATIAHILEPLTFTDGTGKVSPVLATSWKTIDPNTWEFDLRHDVKFTDGSDFTAADVVFSIKRVPLVKSPASLTYFTKSIESVTAVDPYTVRMKTNTPDPELPAKLAFIAILSHTAAAGSAPEGKTTTQLNTGDGLVGTGPYKFVSYIPKETVVLTSNPNYWGGKPAWDKVTFRTITSDASRAAAVLSGEVDLAQIPQESLDMAQKSPNVTVTTGDTCQFIYLALDERDKTPTVTGTDGKNPLKDARVRKALSLAINRKALADRVLSGLGTPTAELGLPTLFGATPGAEPDPYDPDQSKKLLAEAGYPNGFGITLNGSSGRYPQDSQLSQAVASMWSRIGVQTAVDNAVGATFYSRRNNGEYSAYLTNFCPTTGQLSYSLRLMAMTRDMDKANGTVNQYSYSNPEVDKVMTQALSTIDDAERIKLVQQASDIVMHRDYGVLSLVSLKFIYAVRKGLVFKNGPDAYLMATRTKAAD